MWEQMQGMLDPAVLWCLLGLALMVAEFILPGLVIFFFGVGALVVALVCAFFNIPFAWQLVIFVLSSGASLFLLRKWMYAAFTGVKVLRDVPEASNSEFVGAKAEAIEDLVPNKLGKIELNGTNWDAWTDETILAGRTVEVIAQKSTRLQVREVK